jgi:HK97 gp10 family phage protein
MRFTLTNKDKFFRRLNSTVDGLEVELKDALAKSGQEMVEKAKSLAPVDEGELRNSIEWKFTRNRTFFGRKRSPAVVVQAGSNDQSNKAFYARWVEFGSDVNNKQPFFFLAYRLLRKRIRSRISRAMTRAAKKAGFA